jgi:hypothetical protein
VRIRPNRIRSLGASLAVAALCAAAYLIFFAPASGSHGQQAPCGPISAETVVADRAARVYRVTTGHDPAGTLHSYYGCTVGHAEPQLLARNAFIGIRLYSCVVSECRLVRAIRLVGATVGVVIERHGTDTVSTTLTVRDLAGAYVLRRVLADTVVGYGDSLIIYVLAQSGNIAWATETTSPGPYGILHRTGTIHRAVGRAISTLDKGPKVRASSLRLRGGTVEWIDGGQQRTASLP